VLAPAAQVAALRQGPARRHPQREVNGAPKFHLAPLGWESEW